MKIKVRHKHSGYVYYVNKINKKIHKPFVPKKTGDWYDGKTQLPDIRTLKCRVCGEEHTYSTKGSYRRAMGIAGLGKTDKKENSGLCGKCRRSAKRKGWAGTMEPRTQEYIDKQRLIAYNNYHNTNYTNINDIPQDRNWKRYKDRVHDRTKVQLKLHSPQMYKKWEENKYDGTDMNALTIDHIKSVRDCFDDGWTVDQACNINNLQLLTMKENIEKELIKDENQQT